MMQELAENQARINTLELNIKKQFGSKRYLGGRTPKIKGMPEVPILNMDLKEYFSQMDNPKNHIKIETKTPKAEQRSVFTPPAERRNVINLNSIFDKNLPTPRLKTSDQARRTPKVLRSNTLKP